MRRDPFDTVPVSVHEYWIRATGTPIPQGSKSAKVQGGRAVMWDTHRGLKGWREQVAQAAWSATQGEQIDAPCIVTIWFYLPRPKTVNRTHMCVKPDVDKLCRAILDGLGDSILTDDSRVVELSARKMYADDTAPGCMIHVRTIKEGTI